MEDADEKELGFRIEHSPDGTPIIFWINGKSRPATWPEVLMWRLLGHIA